MSIPLRSLARHCSRLVSGKAHLEKGVAAQWSRSWSTAPAAAEDDDDDIVLKTFKQQQHSFRVLMDGIKSIHVPLDGNEAGLKKYVQDMEALKRKAGMPEVDEVVQATLEYKAKCSRGDIRRFLAEASEGVELGEYEAVVTELLGAVDAVEEAHGALDADNQAGWDDFKAKAVAIQKKHGLEDGEKIKQDYLLEMYSTQLKNARASAQEAMDALRRKEGLEGLHVDAGTLKPSF